MTAPARAAAFRALTAIAANHRDLPTALVESRRRLTDERDRSLAAAIVHGTLRWQRACDYLIEGVSERPLESLDRDVLVILRLSLYQIHSVTPDSPALSDSALHERLARLADEGVTVGLSTSGPNQADTIRAALSVTVSGRPLFGSVQTTYNLLERSAGEALAEAHDAGCAVIVKEALANGRLAEPYVVAPEMSALREIAQQTGASCDAVALAAVAAEPWADVVLSGAATVDQLTSNLAAARVKLQPTQCQRLTELAEPAGAYWTHRSQLAWA